MRYSKPALDSAGLVALWESRGLIIPNKAEAEHYLRYIGYYRLSGYALPLTRYNVDGSHQFKPNVEFEHILRLYVFDRELRLHVMDAIERVEVAFRACLSNLMSIKGGPHWFMDKKWFGRTQARDEFGIRVAEECGLDSDGNRKNGREVFLDHYFTKYNDPKLPPSWMVAEILSISCWSKLYSALVNRSDRKQIAEEFGISPEIMESWIRAICYLRNLCAHHSRLWNRDFTITPRIAHGHPLTEVNNRRFFGQAYVLKVLLEKAAPNTTWWDRLMKLLNANPFIDRSAIGFE